MQLRRLERHDLEDCARLYAQVFVAEPWKEPWNAERALARLAHFHDSHGFVGMLAETDEQGDIVGFALGTLEPFCTNSLFYLREMCVSASQQSKGVGTQLYSALERELTMRGAGAIYLATDRTIPAAGFYQGLGFHCSDNMAFFAKRL
ncbi:GNAT family N-acetyltransferase [Billgrantia saliphila]|uniref:GNAT family N-acetyltransferase n=1 Tax=Billgrantia saliphila TaxID=1848458 RepID=UPI000CE405D2|nr:GNAT family N-acetyltransferase [Halomonas saliphila]